MTQPQTSTLSWIPRKKEKLLFVINVTLPSPTHGVSHLPGLTIDMPEFALDVDDLSAFDFDALTLRSTNSPITVKVSHISITWRGRLIAIVSEVRRGTIRHRRRKEQ